jgi:hypothetical protein
MHFGCHEKTLPTRDGVDRRRLRRQLGASICGTLTPLDVPHGDETKK